MNYFFFLFFKFVKPKKNDCKGSQILDVGNTELQKKKLRIKRMGGGAKEEGVMWYADMPFYI